MVTIYFYKSPSSKEVVNEFIDNLDDITKARVRNAINLLRKYCWQLFQTKWVKKIHQNPSIFELRITKGKQVRLFFISYKQDTFILLHGFIKKSQKTPKKEVEIGIKRAKEFI